MPRIRSALVLAATAVLVPIAPVGSHAASQVQCTLVDFAPIGAHSQHVLCVDFTADDPPVPTASRVQHVMVRISNDNGKTWQNRSASGIPARPEVCEPPRPSSAATCQWGTRVVAAFHSAGWVADKTLYLGIVGAGLYKSTDDGQTWSLASTTGAADGGPGYVDYEPFHDPTPTALSEVGSNPIAYVVSRFLTVSVNDPAPPQAQGSYGFVHGPERIDPPVSKPVSGVPEQSQDAFLFASAPRRGQPVLGVGTSFGSGDGQWDFARKMHTGLYVCDYDLTCTTRLHDFGPGQWTGVGMSGDYAKSGVLYAVLVDQTRAGDPTNYRIDIHYQRSSDGGKHFTTWSSLEALREPARRIGGGSWVSLATREGNGSELIAMVQNYCYDTQHGENCGSASRPPDYQFFSSHDDGAHWTHITDFYDGYSQGRAPVAKWSSKSSYPAMLQMGPGGRLLLQERTPHYDRVDDWYWDDIPDTSVLWCSLDHGRTWSSPCKG